MIDKILEFVKPKRKILILTHNNPDPDTISAAFALKNLLSNLLKKRCTIAYDGIIGRAENRELVKACKIPLHPSSMLNFARYDSMIVVDTQPTAGNVTIPKGFFPDVVIDHHNFRIQTKKAKIYDVRPDFGSTCTIISEYYKKLQLALDKDTATALYYGMKTDTLGSARSNTQEDLNMMGHILPKMSLKKLAKIEAPELPRYYFKNIKKAIDNSVVIDDLIFCDLKEVRNADLIAETSDLLLRMREVKWTFVIGSIDTMCFFSLRCKSPRRKVGHIALNIVKGLGTGGGHMQSAGGQIPIKKRTYEELVKLIKNRLIKKIGLANNDEKII